MIDLEYIKSVWNFQDARELEDGTVIGIGSLIFTTAIYIDVNEHGWSQRFCFTNSVDAVLEYQKIKTGDDEPKGYIARRQG